MPEQSNTQKVIKGVSSQTLVTVLMGVLELLVFSIFSRLLSKEDFGLFAAVSSVTVIFSSLSEAGIGSAIIQKKDASKSYINTAFTISLILGSFFTILLIVLSGTLSRTLIDETLRIPLMFMSITILCNSLTSVNTSIMYKRLEFFQVGMVNFVSLLISSIIAIVLAQKGMGFEAIMSKSILHSLIAMFLSYYLAHTHFTFHINKSNIKSIISFGGWLTLSVFLRNFSTQADKLLMSRFLSVSSLGAYNRPKEFINTISAKLNGIFDTALFPILSGIQDEKQSLQNAYHLSLYYMNIFSMLMALGFIFNGNLIIRIFFGSQWLSLLPIFIVLSLSLLFNIDGRLCDCYFRSLGLVKYQFFIRLFEVILTLVCLLIGFHWDIIGVSIAVLVSNFITIVLKLIVVTIKIESSFKAVAKQIMSGWRFSLLVVPIMFLSQYLLPKTFVGNIIELAIFGVVILLIFIIMPGIVGDTYKTGLYKTIINKLAFANKNKIN